MTDTDHRVAFTFDDQNYQLLEAYRVRAGAKDLAGALAKLAALAYGLQAQVDDGYTEIIARNPSTGHTRTLKPRYVLL